MQEEEKKRKLEQEKNRVLVEKQEVIPFLWEIDTCKWLINHFQKALISTSEETPQEQDNKQEIVKTDNTDSKLKAIDLSKREDEQPIQTSEERKDKKAKGLKKKENNQNEKDLIDFLVDINLINRIQEIKLSPPGTLGDVPSFLVELKKRLGEFEKRSEEEKVRIKVIIE